MGAFHFLWVCGCGATNPPFEEVGPTRKDRSDYQERCVRDLRAGIVKRRRDAFRGTKCDLRPNDSRRLQTRIGSGNDDPYESVDGSFMGIKPLFNGPLTYGWSKNANTVQGFNEKPLPRS